MFLSQACYILCDDFLPSFVNLEIYMLLYVVFIHVCLLDRLV